MSYPLTSAPSYYHAFDWSYTGQKRNGVFYPGDTIQCLRPYPATVLNGLQKYATFENGVNGNTIGTTRQEASPATCQFSAIAGSPIYDNTHAAHGTLSAKIDGTTTNSAVGWSRVGVPDFYARFYLYATQNPTASFATVWNAPQGGVDCAVRVTSAGKLNIVAVGVTALTFTNSIPLNQWFRVEFHILYSQSNAGVLDIRMFLGDSTTPIEQQSISSINTGASPPTTYFGAGGLGTGAWGAPFWMDDIAANLSAFPGPYANETPTLETFNYTVLNNLTGTTVSSGTFQGEYLIPATPGGGWPYGCFRVEVTGSQTDANFGPSYGATNITLVRSDANWPVMPANTVGGSNGNTEAPDYVMKGVMGLGTTRFIIDNAGAPTTGSNTLALAVADASIGATWWQNPGSPYADSSRTRYMWCTFPNGGYDWLTVGSFAQIYCKDGTIDGSKVFISASPGTGSTTTLTVYYPNSTTVVETYPNLNNSGISTAINGISNYIIAFAYQNNNQTTMSATAIGNSKFNGVQQVVSTLYPLGVTRFEGPQNEPPQTVAQVQAMKIFQAAVHAGNASAKAIGPCCVDLASTINLLNLGIGAYCDEISSHAYHTGTNGSISEMRAHLDALNAAIVSNGLTGKTLWQTESTSVLGSVYGVYHPRRFADELGQLIFYEQYGITKERNNPWYDISHGFWSVPEFHEAADGSLEPSCAMSRVLAEEIWGMTYQSALDFGTIGNQIYYGNIYSGASGSVAAVVPASYIPGASVTLSVSGASGSLTAVDGMGNLSSLLVSGGRVTMPLGDQPAYLRLPSGVSISGVFACNDWGTTSLPASVSPSATTKTLGGATPPLSGSVASIADGAWMTNYASTTGLVASGVVINDGVNPATTDSAVLGWSSNQQIGRVIIWCGMCWQPYPTLIDFDVQVSTDSGNNWTTVKTITKSSPTVVNFGTDTTNEACQYETFMDEQWIFDIPLAQVYTANAMRLFVRQTTWGGEASFATQSGMGQGGLQRISLQEIGVFSGPISAPATTSWIVGSVPI